MVATAKRSEHPISMRLPEADIAIIGRAAGLRGPRGLLAEAGLPAST